VPDELARLMKSAVTDLRLNFVDEKGRHGAANAKTDDASSGADA
jgi:hypothetical protein